MSEDERFQNQRFNFDRNQVFLSPPGYNPEEEVDQSKIGRILVQFKTKPEALDFVLSFWKESHPEFTEIANEFYSDPKRQEGHLSNFRPSKMRSMLAPSFDDEYPVMTLPQSGRLDGGEQP